MSKRESVMVGGALSATAPAAGTVLAQINIPDSGYWELNVWAVLTGAADAPNKVSCNIPNRGNVIIPMASSIGGSPGLIKFARLYLAVTQQIILAMNAAGGAGAQFAGWLLLNPLD